MLLLPQPLLMLFVSLLLSPPYFFYPLLNLRVSHHLLFSKPRFLNHILHLKVHHTLLHGLLLVLFESLLPESGLFSQGPYKVFRIMGFLRVALRGMCKCVGYFRGAH